MEISQRSQARSAARAALNLNGSGTLVLSGVNTSYGGLINLNAGNLQVTDNNSLGTAAVSFLGGTLQFGASNITLSHTLNLLTTISTIDTQGYTDTVSGAVAGGDALAKIGSGTLILTNGSNSYPGGTYLDAGILNVTSNGALGNSSGALTFNGGTLQIAAEPHGHAWHHS